MYDQTRLLNTYQVNIALLWDSSSSQFRHNSGLPEPHASVKLGDVIP